MASYFTIVIPLILLAAKAILRLVHRFHLIDTAQRLGAGINDDIIQGATALINANVISYLDLNPWNRIDTEEVQWINQIGDQNTFKLTAFPDFIFKMSISGEALPPDMGEGFANIIKSKNVCLIHQLDCLIIPQVRFFQIGRYSFIIEEHPANIQYNGSAQEELYRLQGLDETIRQLAVFIGQAGFNSVSWENMPVLDTAPDFAGNRKVALMNLQELDGAMPGFFGGIGAPYRGGLVHCLHSADQIDIALEEARRCNIPVYYGGFGEPPNYDYVAIKAQRLEKIEEDRRLREFHERAGCLSNPRKPIEVNDLDSLGLNLEEELKIYIDVEVEDAEAEDGIRISQERKIITLRDAAIAVIDYINEALDKTPDPASVKGKRRIELLHRDNAMKCYPSDWLDSIVKALVAKGHLFKIDIANGNGFLIQA